ncbi:MAG: type II toxin-antitoxin system RelE/ParE family toxin [Saprospiraceae bacterium]|nr:type II toxin-antitoxin system RelE/ParE family toxin [Saprospiraceae bacterium]
MPFSVIFAKRANQDLQEILDYYNRESPATSQAFLRELIASIDFVAENPKASPIAFAKVRKKVLPKFPFNIYYSVKEKKKEVVVARIWHHKRNPSAIMG